MPENNRINVVHSTTGVARAASTRNNVSQRTILSYARHTMSLRGGRVGRTARGGRTGGDGRTGQLQM
ncbi:conserved hypothetical protein [Ricinus communis]|uniref:Uncharacterized protein n=1 Tax=Ricinus communis TaxID=3988 RepID=B9SJT8_RICCO|nr:conserved hypothetical protein [Ricinus communis]